MTDTLLAGGLIAERRILRQAVEHPGLLSKTAGLPILAFSSAVHSGIYAAMVDTLRGCDAPPSEAPDAKATAAFEEAVKLVLAIHHDARLRAWENELRRLLNVAEQALELHPTALGANTDRARMLAQIDEATLVALRGAGLCPRKELAPGEVPF